MTTSENGRNFIKSMEGCSLVGYLDQGGVPTCCVGHTGPGIAAGTVYTSAQCDAFLEADLATAESAVNRYVKPELSQNQFDSLVSLTFNIGARNFQESTVLKRLNLTIPPDFEGAGDAFMMWVTVDGETNQGLVNRRTAERALFLTP
jgi:lysozyme